jgi:hypothetical protein
MAKSTSYANYLLGLIFLGQDIPGLARNAAAPNANLYLSLHKQALGVGDTQSAHEATYTGYARVAVPRSTLGFTLASNRVTLATKTSFPECVAGTETYTHWAIGTDASGSTLVLYSGALNDSITMEPGVQPRLTPASFVDET